MLKDHKTYNVIQDLILKTSLVVGVLVGGFYGINQAYAKTAIKSNEIVVLENVYHLVDKDLIKVAFTKGSAELSRDSLSDLVDFAKITRGESKIDEYIEWNV